MSIVRNRWSTDDLILLPILGGFQVSALKSATNLTTGLVSVVNLWQEVRLETPSSPFPTHPSSIGNTSPFGPVLVLVGVELI